MSLARNNRKITKDFDLLTKVKDRVLQQKLCIILDNAVTEALRIHQTDPTHHHHLEMGDDYGWILVYNGRIVQEKYYTTARNNGMLRGKLSHLAALAQSPGYVGVVAAGMQNKRPNYYSLRFETDVLQQTIQYTIATAPSQF